MHAALACLATSAAAGQVSALNPAQHPLVENAATSDLTDAALIAIQYNRGVQIAMLNNLFLIN